MIIKAVAGGGGRGVRIVDADTDLGDMMTRAAAEAESAFGNGALYVERYLPHARHIEVQIVGDGSGHVAHLGERDCSIQRRFQKIIEIAPSPRLDANNRAAICAAAVRIAESVKYDNVGTMEFLVSEDGSEFAFIEANARLQVEHTITEEVMGVDLVRIQLDLAQGASLASLPIPDEPRAHGFAIQLRINTERMKANGTTLPASGTLATFQPPTGPGVRVDTQGYPGFQSSPGFDSLLAKLIVHSPTADFRDCITRALRALSEFHIDGIQTNRDFLANIVRHGDFASGNIHTRFVDENMKLLANGADDMLPKRYVEREVVEVVEVATTADAAKTGLAQGTIR
jgi:pyruvate carboxylase